MQLIEKTPRNALLETIALRIRKGLSYRQTLAALLLTGVRNVQPRPVLVQRLLRCTRVTEDALRFAFRRRDLTGAEQVHRDISVEIVQLTEFQCPCFLGRNVRLNKLTIRGCDTA